MCMSSAKARTKQEILYRNLAKRPLIGSVYRDLAKRSLLEILFRDLAQRPLTGILPTELLSRSCTEITCQKTSYRDLVQRPGEESSVLAQRSFVESLNKDPTLRPLAEIFCGDLLQKDLFKSLAKRPLVEILCRDLARTPLLLEILHRDIA